MNDLTPRCSEMSCDGTATMGLITTRTPRREVRTAVRYDVEDCPKTAYLYCRYHGKQCIASLIDTLVPESAKEKEEAEPKPPLQRPCPACHVPAGKPCTVATLESRKPVSWFHTARESQS